MSKSIKTLEKEFVSAGLMEIENKQLKEQITILNETINLLTAEVDRLRESQGLSNPDASIELNIIEGQIQRIRESSLGRMLSLEETKMLDLHIKNKNLILQRQPKDLEPRFRPLPESDEELLRIAESVQNTTTEGQGS